MKTTKQHKDGAFHLKLIEVKKIFYACNNFRNRCLIKSLFWCGLRRNEAINLDVRDIDFERRRIKICGKGGKLRIIPVIEKEYLSDLKHLIGKRKQGVVFTNPRGKKLSLHMVNNITRQAGELANIKNPNPRLRHINPHIFRHSIARFLKSKSFSLEWIQNFLGHSSYKMTMDMYGTISLDEMQEQAENKLVDF